VCVCGLIYYRQYTIYNKNIEQIEQILDETKEGIEKQRVKN